MCSLITLFALFISRFSSEHFDSATETLLCTDGLKTIDSTDQYQLHNHILEATVQWAQIGRYYKLFNVLSNILYVFGLAIILTRVLAFNFPRVKSVYLLDSYSSRIDIYVSRHKSPVIWCEATLLMITLIFEFRIYCWQLDLKELRSTFDVYSNTLYNNV